MQTMETMSFLVYIQRTSLEHEFNLFLNLFFGHHSRDDDDRRLKINGKFNKRHSIMRRSNYFIEKNAL